MTPDQEQIRGISLKNLPIGKKEVITGMWLLKEYKKRRTKKGRHKLS
jgi:hypothetical protein